MDNDEPDDPLEIEQPTGQGFTEQFGEVLRRNARDEIFFVEDTETTFSPWSDRGEYCSALFESVTDDPSSLVMGFEDGQSDSPVILNYHTTTLPEELAESGTEPLTCITTEGESEPEIDWLNTVAAQMLAHDRPVQVVEPDGRERTPLLPYCYGESAAYRRPRCFQELGDLQTEQTHGQAPSTMVIVRCEDCTPHYHPIAEDPWVLFVRIGRTDDSRGSTMVISPYGAGNVRYTALWPHAGPLRLGNAPEGSVLTTGTLVHPT